MNTGGEQITVRGGLGDLEVCLHREQPSLLVEGAPSLLVWGSAAPGRWLLRARDLSAIVERVGHLPATVSHFDPQISLGEQIAPLLETLVDGRYLASLILSADVLRDDPRTAADPHLPPRAPNDRTLMAWVGLHHVGGADPLLLGSIPLELLDDERIHAVSRAILAGRQPAVVALTTPHADVSFIVHGHEALEAYARARLPPPVVLLTSLTPRAVSDATMDALTHDAVLWCGAMERAHADAVRQPVAP